MASQRATFCMVMILAVSGISARGEPKPVALEDVRSTDAIVILERWSGPGENVPASVLAQLLQPLQRAGTWAYRALSDAEAAVQHASIGPVGALPSSPHVVGGAATATTTKRRAGSGDDEAEAEAYDDSLHTALNHGDVSPREMLLRLSSARFWSAMQARMQAAAQAAAEEVERAAEGYEADIDAVYPEIAEGAAEASSRAAAKSMYTVVEALERILNAKSVEGDSRDGQDMSIVVEPALSTLDPRPVEDEGDDAVRQQVLKLVREQLREYTHSQVALWGAKTAAERAVREDMFWRWALPANDARGSWRSRAATGTDSRATETTTTGSWALPGFCAVLAVIMLAQIARKRHTVEVLVMVEHNGQWVRAIAHVPLDGDNESGVAASGDVRVYGVVPNNASACMRAPLLCPNLAHAHVVVAAEEAAIKA
ncbi:hypothetical protein FOA52_005530 [Chlamydomonas sp. UWO 241]|nr:hypothetical protein FOA52_005530 [Chlamydomonas sp. UWO 241]